MTKDGIIKLAGLNKQAGGLWQDLTAAGKVGIILAAIGIGGVGFSAGMAASRITAPRASDLDNIARQYRIARLRSDLEKQDALLDREQVMYNQTQNKPKKSVYGIV